MNDPLQKKLNEIPLPPQLHARCVQGIKTAQQEMEKKKMKYTEPNNAVKFRLPKRAFAVFAAAVCTLALAGSALAGPIKGFFADVTRWDGAVTGTEYHAQPDELALTAAVQGQDLVVDVHFEMPDEAPYAFLEQFAAGKYQVLDAAGSVVAEGEKSEAAAVQSGQVQLVLPGAAAHLAAGQYTLQLTEFIGSAKADQPLPILGSWQCGFAVE
ncbi:MAG: hypothetical protein IJ347_00245 [Faecalibacterium sp.]|nr:hypothetical protein [Faecalibacterium sp.]